MADGTRGEGGASFFGRVWSRFGTVARKLGIVHEHDINEALDHQETAAPRKKLGEILVEKGKMTDDHVKAVLKEQESASAKAEAAKLTAKAPAPKKKTAKKAKKKAAKKTKKKTKAKSKPKARR